MFNPDFYPTPPEVAALMLDPLDLRGKVVLEPSAGKGDLVRHCLARFAEEVVWCETDGSYGDHLAPDQQEALDMICHKIGRIINGDPDYADSWHDIAGYAQLVADRLNGVER